MSSADFRYDIEGELLTVHEITARATERDLSPATVRSRLHYGDRTWARLLRKPDMRPRRNHPFHRHLRG